MSNFVLQIKNLTKAYKKRLAVDNISFSVFSGEIFGFLGPNGAGKTTTIRMIAGLTRPTSGTIKICGFNVKTQFEKAIRNVGGIIENPELYSYMSGLDNLKYYASLYKNISKNKINEIVKLVGMENRIKDKVKTYSLGMRQRVGIAQALLHDPKLLILDEPTNGLDPSGIKEMRRFLIELAHKKQIAILISSHILSEMEQLCDTVAIIDRGQIIEIKQIEQIMEGVKESQKVSIKVDYPNYAGKIIMNRLKVKVELAGNNIIFPISDKIIPKATSILIAKGISIYGVTTIIKSLEEVFIDILQKNKAHSPTIAVV